MTEAEKARMLEAARAAMERAYAPYSGFRVGAALLARGGGMFAGCNVENASYPVGLCAERAALAAAVASGVREFEALLIVAESRRPCPPCGMCRQALAEFGVDLQVVLVSSGGAEAEYRLGDLLPEAFTPGFLRGGVEAREMGNGKQETGNGR